MSADTAPVETESQPITGSPESSATPESAPEHVSKEEFAKLQERINGQSATLGRLTGQLEKVLQQKTEPQKPVDDDGKSDGKEKPNGDTDGYKAMRAELDAMRDKRERQKMNTLRHKINTELVKLDADVDLAEIAVDAMLAKHGKNFIADEDDLGNDVFTYRQPDGVDIGLGAWAQSFMDSDKGQKILSAKRPPVGNGSTSHGADIAGITYVSKSELGKLSSDQLSSGKFLWDGK